ncbi:protein NEOXANTHIN-DEFICIENT 1 isoform X1 [Lycium ferocissimum]|uniref:protein NEOXANTHIN-DEFICIENT 1 isoform X1 n=1 Tax=Lycium ferocissimum TaxID=112874 RepID=UPI002816067E|nr:protein NEOXANTHIN-DEFICIENT 1 isoform X1 [Lycium ferocissimum]XP_059316254.1 protein NEOXANTHIN-DEFICIENT 1 isoform X1 [Lycium ferocissimum]XP_059316255.1 protein NEOXANTHIN-DEFICIENT 1 isoform X1 [Lycium ferocissimum]
MEVKDRNSAPLAYGEPPWIFKGSALYQLHLVKAETARAFIPKECRLVEAFGYTLGGFFLASYDDSPAGIFDELVVIAGLVWNPPTSCAWAARVLVGSDEACLHGRKVVGLPSQIARFSKKITALPRMKSKTSSFLSTIGLRTSPCSYRNHMDIEVRELKNQKAMNICSINLNVTVSQQDSKGWMGPLIKMSLPNFSGRTKYNSNLLKYSCQIECRVRAVRPAKVSGPSALDADVEDSSEYQSSNVESVGRAPIGTKRNFSISVLLSKPILALEFNHLKMRVEAPTTVIACSQNTI